MKENAQCSRWIHKRIEQYDYLAPKKWAKEAARKYKEEHGGTMKAHTEIIESIATNMVEKRQMRRISRKSDVLQNLTPSQRFEKMTRKFFNPSDFKARTAANGHEDSIQFVPDDQSVDAYGVVEQIGWYSGSMSNWRKYGSQHVYILHKNWCTRVYKRKLDLLDGLLTLDASSVDVRGDVVIYAAVWAKQGRGSQIVAEHGWIATNGTMHYHSTKSIKAARSGLSRKITLQAKPELREQASIRMKQQWEKKRMQFQEQITRFEEQFKKGQLHEYSDVEVTIKDSLNAGNCKSGTDDFVDRLFGYPVQSATIQEICHAIDREHNNIETWVEQHVSTARSLLAACLVAVRRHKKKCRIVDVRNVQKDQLHDSAA